MKDIKFRAKRLDGSAWAYGGLIQCDDYCIIDQGNEVYVEEEYNFRGDTHLFKLSGVMCDEKTIGQFTQLYDKKDKAIYEDDILQITINGVKFLYIVKWNTEVGAWCLMFKDDTKEGVRPLGIWLCDSECEIEVIGNIFDNKELLED